MCERECVCMCEREGVCACVCVCNLRQQDEASQRVRRDVIIPTAKVNGREQGRAEEIEEEK